MQIDTSTQRSVSGRVSFQEDVRYGPDPCHMLDICIPDTMEPSPGVILIHGGGWRRGDKMDLRGQCRQWAKRGILAASINYRLASQHANRWPSQIVDCQLAIRWIRANAPKLNLDPDRIGAWGFSAGAHLAVFAGIAKQAVPGDFSTELGEISSQVASVISSAGPVDLTDPAYRTPNALLFGDRHRDHQKERKASPVFQIDEDAPPMLVVHGRSDHLVPIEQSKRLIAALRKYSVPVHQIFHSGAHGAAALQPEERQAIFEAQIAFTCSPREELPSFGYDWQD